jgi:hypothetical protein
MYSGAAAHMATTLIYYFRAILFELFDAVVTNLDQQSTTCAGLLLHQQLEWKLLQGFVDDETCNLLPQSKKNNWTWFSVRNAPL